MEAIKSLTENLELAAKVKLEVTAGDLRTFAEYLLEKAEENRPVPPEVEEYLTADEVAGILKVSKVTLWNWDNKGITTPLRIGNQKRYRRSDIETFLTRESSG